MIKRKILKIVFKIIITGLIILSISFIIFYIWLNFRLSDVTSSEEYRNFSNSISKSETIPNNFYKMYCTVHGYDENSTTKVFLIKEPFKQIFRVRKTSDCPCVEVNYGFVLNTFDRWSIGLALDKDVTPKKCLDFHLSNFDFTYGIKGVKNASKKFYNKELQKLSQIEMIELSVMMINPSLYNKITHPKRLRNRALTYLIK